jgi:hypothetical protein
MKLSDEVKRQALQSMEAAHHAKARRLLARLRICDLSLKTMAALWRLLRAAPFLSIADAEPFDAYAAEIFVENADAMIAELAGVAREQIVIIEVHQADNLLSICASLGEGPDAAALAALVFGVGGAAQLLSWGPDRTWERGADGQLRLGSNQTAAPDSGASRS